MDCSVILFARRIHIAYHHLIGNRQYFCELVEKRLCTAVGMRLKDNPHTLFIHILCACQRGFDFGRVMRIIVYYLTAVNFPDMFKSALCSAELRKPRCHRGHIYSQKIRRCRNRKRVEHIMPSRDVQFDFNQLISAAHNIKPCVVIAVKRNILSRIISLFIIYRIFNHFFICILHNFAYVFIVRTNNYAAKR